MEHAKGNTRAGLMALIEASYFPLPASIRSRNNDSTKLALGQNRQETTC